MITYNIEDIDFQLEEETTITQWLEATVVEENKELEGVNYIFCSDEYLYKMNVEYLNHDYYTDVITFQYNKEKVEGDIFISVDRTNDHAKDYGVTPKEELHRVIVHGLLHLIGYNDKTDEDQEIMTQKEDYYLRKLSQ